MLVGAKVCDLTEDLLWFVCGLYVGILTSSRTRLTWELTSGGKQMSTSVNKCQQIVN